MNGFEVEAELTAFRDLLRAFDRFRERGKKLPHLRLGFDVQLVGLHAHPLIILKRLACLNAHQHFLRLGVSQGQVMAVVGNDHGNPGLFGEPDQPREDRLFIRQTVIHQLDIKMIRSHDPGHAVNKGPCILIAAVQQGTAQVAGKTG